MNDLKSIVGGAFRNRLAALTHEYLKMQSMASNDRDSYLSSLMCYADEIQSKIDGSETQRAKLILLKFQYASRIIYSVDEQIISHFCDRLKWEKWEEGKEILSWRFTPPSESDFLRVMLSWQTRVDFYKQVNELCGTTFGLPLPGVSEPFDQYTVRAGIAEASWRWRYDNAIEKERKSWFTSKRKLAEIENQRSEHRKKSEECLKYLFKIYSRIRPSAELLQELKRTELNLSTHLDATEDAYHALCEGVPLKNLLIEEGHDLSQTYSEITRGL